MRRILCVEQNQIYPAISIAAKIFNVDAKSINQACKRVKETAAGLHWVYEDEAKLFKEKNGRKIEVKDIKKRKPMKKDWLNKKVYCYELNRVFQSIVSAAEELNLHTSNISGACKGKLSTTGKFHWMYLEDLEEFRKKNKRDVTLNDFKNKIKAD